MCSAFFLAESFDPGKAPFGGLLILAGYYLIVWLFVGVDPKKGKIVMTASPPRGISPAAMRHIVMNRFDNRTFVCAVLDIAVKGHASIMKELGQYVMKREDGSQDPLFPDEQAIAVELFHGVAASTRNLPLMRRAGNVLRAYLQTALGGKYFVMNSWYMIPGLGISLFILLAMFTAPGRRELVCDTLIALVLMPVALGVFVWLAGVAKKRAAAGTDISAVTIAVCFVALFFLLFFLNQMWEAFSYDYSSGTAGIVMGVFFLNFMFYHLLKAPTKDGRRMLDAVEGFKLFLTSGVQALPKEQVSNSLFESFLPYAVALDCERDWAIQFRDDYRPRWYAGDDWGESSSVEFPTKFVNGYVRSLFWE